ncbi:unnamed protein product, partial [Effrenium voratum]
YKTTKRFGVDGGEAAVSGLNAAIEKAASMGMSECVIGMPHRGRLNVLTNVVRKPLVQMFAEFKGTHYDFEKIVETSEGDDWLFAGDVKYHLGTSQADESFGSELRVSKLRSYQLFCEDMLADCSRSKRGPNSPALISALEVFSLDGNTTIRATLEANPSHLETDLA